MEAKVRDAAGPQDVEQSAPTAERVGEMMQYAAGRDDVEGAVERGGVQDIGLGIFDFVSKRRWRLALGRSKAPDTQIDRENARATIFLRNFNRIAASAAAGDENVDRFALRGELRNT